MQGMGTTWPLCRTIALLSVRLVNKLELIPRKGTNPRRTSGGWKPTRRATSVLCRPQCFCSRIHRHSIPDVILWLPVGRRW